MTTDKYTWTEIARAYLRVTSSTNYFLAWLFFAATAMFANISMTASLETSQITALLGMMINTGIGFTFLQDVENTDIDWLVIIVSHLYIGVFIAVSIGVWL